MKNTLRSSLALIVALSLPRVGDLRADPQATSLTIRHNGSDFEGLQEFELEWNAISNATYGVHVSTNLESGSWEMIDLVTPAGNVGSYRVPPSIRGVVVDKHLFSRLILPQPQIFAVEPAIFPPGAPVDAYVIGQCFETNDTIRVDGVPLAGMVRLSANQFSGPLPPLSVGSHLVELVRDGVVKSSFTVTCADAVANPELVLQGPPDAPPASPNGLWLSKKGYEYYKAKSDFSSANTQNNPYFNENPNYGEVPTGAGGGNPLDSRGNRGAVIQFDVVNAKTPARSSSLGGVSPFSGEVQVEAIDLAISGRGLNFIWARTYNSRIGRSTAPNGWSFSFDLHLQPLGGDILIHNGTGRADRFKPDTNGVYTCPEFFAEGSLSNNVFKLTHADSGYWEFKPLTASADAGKLAKIVDRNGNTMTLYYNGAGKLAQVVDDLGRTNTVGYDVAGRLASVTDFSGRTVSYEYDGNGDLIRVISPPVTGTPNGNDFPGGKTNSYTYSSGYLDDRENHLLAQITDSDGRVLRRYVYQHNQSNLEFLRCISVQHWTNPPAMISYLPQTPTPTNGFATTRCIVNDPVGNVTECFTDARGRCVKLEEFTGRATPGVAVTASVNRPTGKLRSSDPDSYVTRWSWNNDSLCTQETLPGGQKMQCIYESDFDAATPARKRADCRVVRETASSPVDVDGDGTGDLTERTWRYEYDPRFGSDATVSRVMRLMDIARERSGEPFLIKDTQAGEVCDDGNTTSGDGCNSDFKVTPTLIEDKYVFTVEATFETSITDPRGNVTKANYDTKGNPIETAYGRSNVVLESLTPTEYTAHNSHGQLTAITNAADANGYRRVDTFSYYTNGPQAGYLQSCVVDAGGLALTENYEYDARGNLTRTIDPLGHDWLYTYNALDQCVRIQSPTNITSRCATDFYYDANDNLVTTTSQLRDASDNLLCGKTQHLRVNPLGQIIRIESAVDCATFMTNDFVYDGNGQCVLALGGDAVSGADPHQAVAFEYDERGLLFREIGVLGSGSSPTNEFSYTPNGSVATKKYVDDQDTPKTEFVYDGFEGLGSDADTFLAMRENKPIVVKDCDNISGSRLKVWQLMQGQSGSQAMRENKPIVVKDCDNISGNRLKVWQLMQGQSGSKAMRVSKITDPMGNVTTFHYDANANLKVVRHFGQTNDIPGTNGNILLAQSSCVYDGLDRLVTQHDAHFNIVGQSIGDGYRTTSFAYAPNGQCTGVTDDLGRTTAIYYDTAGRGTNVTSPNQKTSFALLLNGNGNAEKCTRTDRSDLGGSPQVFTWTNKFDSLGRCISTVNNVGNTNLYAYDSLSRRVRVRDQNGVVSFRSYDLLGRQTLAVTDLNNDGLADFVHDITSSSVWSSSNGRLLATSDSHGNTTSYGYDSLGRTTSITNADNTLISLIWSPRSNLIQEIDPNGTVVTHTYDANDRCISNNITPGAGVAATTTFETFAYDGSSRLIAAVNDSSSCTFTYDSHDNHVSETRNGLTTSSTYDALGNRLSLTYPGGRVLTYAYNALDLCTNILESSVSLASFDYDSPDRLARIAYANGMRTRIFYDGISGTPNASGDFGHGQVSRILHAMNGGSPQISEVRLAWDRNGNKIQRNDAIFQPAIPRTNTLVLNYDAADRLFRSIKLHDLEADRFDYTLDRVGNRQSVAYINFTNGGILYPYVMDTNIPPGDFQMNQYTATPYDTRSYDENGNLIGRSFGALSFVSYGYDYAGRLVSVNDSSNPVSEYAYDALGRRIAKMVFDNGGGPPVTTEFYFDGGSIIEERVNNTVIANLISQSEDGLTILSIRNGQGYFHHTDDQGNTLALTTTGGVVVERYDYDDYGAVTFLTSDGTLLATNSSPAGNPFLFHSMEWDAETGFYHDGSANPWIVLYGAKAGKTGKAKQSLRYADPITGRGIGSGGGNFGDNNPWSDGRIVRKMIPVTVPDISGGQRSRSPKSTNSADGVKNPSRGSGYLRKLVPQIYSAKQGSSGRTK